MQSNAKFSTAKNNFTSVIILVFYSFLLGSCASIEHVGQELRGSSLTPGKPSIATADKGNRRIYTIAMVGDSITYDSGDKNQYAWIHRLRTQLGENFAIHNFGVNGATALRNSNKPYWQQPELGEALELQPDAVFIMLGTNDSKTENWRGGDNHFQVDYLNLIAQFSSLPHRPKIWLGKNLPAFSDGWTINGGVIETEILPTVNLISHMTNIDLVDLHTPFLNRPELFSDGIHPNWDGGNELVKAVSFAIKSHCMQTQCTVDKDTHE